MTHPLTPPDELLEHWCAVGKSGNWQNALTLAYRACLLELRARIEALEATQQPNSSASLTSSPAGSLVERVGNRMPLLPDGRVDDASARAAILEVAAWLRASWFCHLGSGLHWAKEFEREASR
jgi:hypothetical protein